MEQYLNIDGSNLWTVKTGRGLPCMLCNGGPGCDDYLGPVAAMIDDLCQVVRFEPRGCGRSTYDGRYALERTVADVEAIRQHYGFERMLIGGHSAGPDVALAYTIAYPDRVLGLFGIAGGRIVNDRDWSRVYKENQARRGEDQGGKVFQADPQVNKLGNVSWRRYVQREHLLSDIAAITCPAVFINAEQDIRPNWPSRQLASLIPNGRYCEIAGAAHVIWLTHGEALQQELRSFCRMVMASA